MLLPTPGITRCALLCPVTPPTMLESTLITPLAVFVVMMVVLPVAALVVPLLVPDERPLELELGATRVAAAAPVGTGWPS